MAFANQTREKSELLRESDAILAKVNAKREDALSQLDALRETTPLSALSRKKNASTDPKTLERHLGTFDETSDKEFVPEAKRDAIATYLSANPEHCKVVLSKVLTPTIVEELQREAPELFDDLCKGVLSALQDTWTPYFCAQLQQIAGMGNLEKYHRIRTLQQFTWCEETRAMVPRLVMGRYKPPTF